MDKLHVAVLAAALLSLTSLGFPRSAAAEGAPASAPVASWLATVPSADLFTPKPTERSSCITCSLNGRSTPVFIGTGFDCSDAYRDLTVQTVAFATNDCVNHGRDGYSNFSVHPTNACTGTYQQSGYATYCCYICP